MGIRGRTCLVALCLIALCLPAAASPGAGQGACVVRLELSAEAAFEDPIARWLNQLCDLIVIQVDAARWDEGSLSQVSLSMGAHQAFSLKTLRLEGKTRFSSSLTGEEAQLSPLCEWSDALLWAGDSVVQLPEAGRLIPVSGEGLARSLAAAAMNMRAWAALARAQACVECQNCGQCEICKLCCFSEALAALADALGDQFDEAAFDKNVLLIDIQPVEARDLLPVTAKEAPEAPDDLTVRLLHEAANQLVRAIAANEAAQLEA